MGQIDLKDLKKILIFWIVFCAGIVIAERWQIALLFILSFSLGGLIIEFFIRNLKNREAKVKIAQQVIIAFVPFLFVCIDPLLLLRLEHCYFNNTAINFDNYIDSEKLSNHKFIFAIDNSGGYLNETIPFGNNEKKIDILKSRLINDLKEVRKNNDETNDFIIIKIGNPNNYNFNKDEWVELEEDKVMQNIENIKKLIPEDNISDFNGFYKVIANICKDDNYTLFIYSDFIHDLTEGIKKPNTEESKKLDKHVKDIKKRQKELTKNKVTQNLFFVSKANINKDERKVLPESTTNYVNLFDVSNNIQQELIPEKIEEENNLLFFYFKVGKSKIRSLLQINFKNNGNNIDDVNGMFKIFDCDGNDKKSYEFNKDNPNSLDYETTEILYEGSPKPKIEPIIKVIRNNRHYIFTCDFVENNNAWWRLWYFLIGILLSGSMSALINKKKRN